MSIVQQNPTSNDIAKLITNVNKTYIGQNKITITNYELDTAPQVTAGSTFDNNGTQWVNDALATPSNYAGIANSTTFYLYYDKSGNVFIYASTTPVWSDAKQGWYNGNDRALFTMFKDSGGTLYENKWLIGGERELFNRKLITSNNYLEGTLTQNVVFDKLAPFISNIGDEMIINGNRVDGGTMRYLNRAGRTGANEITLYGTTASVVSNITVTNGDATATVTSLSW